MLEGYITANEAAKILKKTSDYIRKLCVKGELQGAYKFGNTWIIPKSSVESYKPKPRGFAAFWEKYHTETQALRQALQEALQMNLKKEVTHD